MNKIIWITLAAIAAIVLGGFYFYQMQTSVSQGPVLGGDRDEHGCIGSAGYSWCAPKNKCLRVWEEKCE